MKLRLAMLALTLLAGCGSALDQSAPGPEAPARLAVAQPTNVTLSLKAGWNAVAFKGTPLTSFNAPPAVFGLAWLDDGTYRTGWVAQNLITELGSTRGYWMYANTPANVSYTASDVSGSKLTLGPGWNLVAFPAPTPIPFYSLDVRREGVPVPIAQVLLPQFMQVNASGNVTPVNITATGTLTPGTPYWVYSLANLTLEYNLHTGAALVSPSATR